MNNTPTWFQQQLNEEAKRIGKSATDRLAIENPSIDLKILKYFYEEHSVQMAANVISNRMLQYFLEQITGLIHRADVLGGQKDIRDLPYRTKSIVDPETKEIKLSRIYEDNENEVIDAVIMFLKMELQMIHQQQMEYQRQMQMQGRSGGVQTIGGSNFVR